MAMLLRVSSAFTSDPFVPSPRFPSSSKTLAFNFSRAYTPKLHLQPPSIVVGNSSGLSPTRPKATASRYVICLVSEKDKQAYYSELRIRDLNEACWSRLG